MKAILIGTRVCRRCNVERPLDQFYTYSYQEKTNCKACLAEMQRQYRKTRPKDYWKNKDRKYTLKSKYGLTMEEYRSRIEAQQSRCAICGIDPSTIPNTSPGHHILHVDHDHVSGKVRDLLCNGCNRALGLLNESIPKAEALVEYLKRWHSRRERAA